MSSSKYKFYVDVLREDMKSYGMIETAKAFDEYINTTSQSDIHNACHSWAHELGESAVRLGYSGADIIQSCTTTCLDGCFNGAGHGYVAAHPDLATVNEFCDPSNIQISSENKNNCFHGIGHGLVDVLGADISKDIKYCNLINSPGGRAQCSHAIFMLFNTIPESRVDLDNIPENMSIFCKNLGPSYSSYCFDFSGYLTYAKHKNIKKAFLDCNNIPSNNRTECLRRIGDILYLFNPKMEPDLIAKQCNSSDINQSYWCSMGVAKLLISDGNNLPEKSFKICSLFEKDRKLSCFREIGEQLESHLSKRDRDKLCSQLDQPYSQSCLGQPIN